MNNFELLPNLHLIFFALLFLIDFVLFHWGLFTLLLAKGEAYKMEKGRKILAISLILFFVILLIVSVFYLVSYFINRGEVFVPTPEELGEFPYPSYIGSAFPPPPEFIKIGRYYFRGPWFLKDSEVINEEAIYAVLCKKDKEYDILYISETIGEGLLRHEQYGCWMENCNQKLNNLYLAILWTSSEAYDFEKRREILDKLTYQVNILCFEPEKEFEEEL